MRNNDSNIGWIIGAIVVIIFAAVIINGNKKTTSTTNTYQTYSAPKITTPTTVPKYTVPETETKAETVTWHCVDATSYDKNAYNDNKCTSSTGEVRYVSDSQSRALDPSYTPGTSGHPYYNSK